MKYEIRQYVASDDLFFVFFSFFLVFFNPINYQNHRKPVDELLQRNNLDFPMYRDAVWSNHSAIQLSHMTW